MKKEKENRRNWQLVGAAGVHFVAARLNVLGLHAAPTIRNVPGIDLLVSSKSATKSAAIQVKTGLYAARHHKRKNNEIYRALDTKWSTLFPTT